MPETDREKARQERDDLLSKETLKNAAISLIQTESDSTNSGSGGTGGSGGKTSGLPQIPGELSESSSDLVKMLFTDEKAPTAPKIKPRTFKDQKERAFNLADDALDLIDTSSEPDWQLIVGKILQSAAPLLGAVSPFGALGLKKSGEVLESISPSLRKREDAKAVLNPLLQNLLTSFTDQTRIETEALFTGQESEVQRAHERYLTNLRGEKGAVLDLLKHERDLEKLKLQLTSEEHLKEVESNIRLKTETEVAKIKSEAEMKTAEVQAEINARVQKELLAEEVKSRVKLQNLKAKQEKFAREHSAEIARNAKLFDSALLRDAEGRQRMYDIVVMYTKYQWESDEAALDREFKTNLQTLKLEAEARRGMTKEQHEAAMGLWRTEVEIGLRKFVKKQTENGRKLTKGDLISKAGELGVAVLSDPTTGIEGARAYFPDYAQLPAIVERVKITENLRLISEFEKGTSFGMGFGELIKGQLGDYNISPTLSQIEDTLETSEGQ